MLRRHLATSSRGSSPRRGAFSRRGALAAALALAALVAGCGSSAPPRFRDASLREQRSAAVARSASACAAGDKTACSAACNELGPLTACAAACDAGDVAACDEGGSRLVPSEQLVASKGVDMLTKGCNGNASTRGVDRRWHACLVLAATEHALGQEDHAKADADKACQLTAPVCPLVRADAARAPRGADVVTPKGKDHEAALVRGYLMALFTATNAGAFADRDGAFLAMAEDHARISALLPALLGAGPEVDGWRNAYDGLDQHLRAPTTDRDALESAAADFLQASLDLRTELGRVYGLEQVLPPDSPAAR